MGLAKRTAQILSLASAMTGTALFSFIVSSLCSEEFIQPYWRIDDDWIWLMLPLGAALGMGLWLRYRQRLWVHVGGVVLVVWPVASIVWILNQPIPRGFEGLGMSLSRAIAIWLAQVAAVTGVVSLVIATAVIAGLSWYESQAFRRRQVQK